MVQRKSISSVHNDRVKRVVRLRRHSSRRETGWFVAEGVREVSRALEAGLRLIELYFCPRLAFPPDIPDTPDTPDTRRVSIQSLVDSIPAERHTVIIEVSPTVMEKLSYRQNPEGLVAVFEQPRYTLDRLDEIHALSPGRCAGSRLLSGGSNADLWLVAVGTQKPGNLGAMARSAAAAGCRGLLVADGVVDAFNPNAIRASTGAVFVLPIVEAAMQAVLNFLITRKVRLLAACPHAKTTIDRVELTGPVAFVMGQEDQGLSFDDARWRQHGENEIEPISIPMVNSTVDSLNVSVAAAVLLYEAVRQRRTSINSNEV